MAGLNIDTAYDQLLSLQIYQSKLLDILRKSASFLICNIVDAMRHRNIILENIGNYLLFF